MLWKRIATAAVLVPLLIASILLSVGRPRGWPFLLLCAVAAALCADEGFRMFLHGVRDRAGGIALAVLVVFSGALLPGTFGVPAVLVCVLLSVFHVLPGAADPAEKARRAATLSFGAVYIGGLLGSVGCAVLYAHGFLPVVPAGYAAAAGAAVGIFGQAGDLFESLIKRAAGVKDSGTILPGHGGILDRADGILAAGPVLYLFAAFSPLAGVGA